MSACQGTEAEFKMGLFLPKVILQALAAVQPNCFIKVGVLSIIVYGHGQDKETMGLVKKSWE